MQGACIRPNSGGISRLTHGWLFSLGNVKGAYPGSFGVRKPTIIAQLIDQTVMAVEKIMRREKGHRLVVTGRDIAECNYSINM